MGLLVYSKPAAAINKKQRNNHISFQNDKEEPEGIKPQTVGDFQDGIFVHLGEKLGHLGGGGSGDINGNVSGFIAFVRSGGAQDCVQGGRAAIDI